MSSEMTRHEERSTGYMAEHGLAWFFALAAVVLGAIGILVGFGILGGDEAGVSIDSAAGAGAAATDWEQGALWLLPAIAIALLSRAFHSSEHHAMRTMGHGGDSSRGMFRAEHWGAYLFGLGAMAAAALTPIVGFDVFDNGNSAQDGMIWALASIGLGIVTDSLHSVRHHQVAMEQEVVVRRSTTETRTVAR